jgi:hypothetical protein
MKIKLYKHDYVIPIIASVLFFFTVKLQMPYYGYALIIVVFGLYFFPVKDIILFNESKSSKKKLVLFSLIANLVLSVILTISIPYLYLKDNSNLKLIITILGIINILFLVFFYLFDNTRSRIMVHIFFIFFTAALIGIP